MIKINTIVISTIVALSIGATPSCKSTSIDPDSNNEQIKPNSSIGNADTPPPTTRALAASSDELTGIVFVRADDARADLTNPDFAATTQITGVRPAGQSSPITFAPPQEYDQVNNKTAYLVGYHPAGTLDTQTKIVEWTPDGSQDILISQVWSAGNINDKKTNGLNFQHALARIEIVLERGRGASLAETQALWGVISEIAIRDMPSQLTYNYTSNVTAPTTNTEWIKLLKGNAYTTGGPDGVIGEMGNIDVKFASMIVVPNGKKDLTLQITNTNPQNNTNTSQVSLQLDKNLAAGKLHTIVITLGPTMKDIKITGSTIRDWDADGGVAGEDVEETLIGKSTIINGMRWATGNLVADGANDAKIGAPTDGGLYFQFGSLVGWAGGATGDGVGASAIASAAVQIKPTTYGGTDAWTTVGRYKGGTADGELLPTTDDAVAGIGDACRHYLGNSWRTPTRTEYKALIPSTTINNASSKFYWSAAMKGAYANATSDAGDAISVFFTAAGYRTAPDGALALAGRFAYYWSASVKTATTGYGLNFHSRLINPEYNIDRTSGYNVRCVQSASLSSDKADNTAPAGAGSFTVTVAGPESGENWTLAETADASAAFTPSAMNGTGSGTFTVAVTENTVIDVAREASYTLTTASGLRASITLKQAGKELDWILINGLKWAKGNLIGDGANGAKIGAPTDYGLYFQFGSLVGWAGGANGDGTGTGSPALGIAVQPAGYTGATTWGSTTGGAGYFKDQSVTSGVVTNLVTDNPATGIGDACRYYLGGTWRLPTIEEYKALIPSADMNTASSKFYWSSAKKGGYANAPSSTGDANSLFFPAAGSRTTSDGSTGYVGSYGYYWSASVTNATYGYSLYFNSGNVDPEYNSYRSRGNGVRCVSQ